MPQSRKSQVSIDVTPFYHCISRCVRRALLCGRDKLTGKSFEHRRAWVEERIKLQAEVFAIDVAAYAVLSNHTHLVLHINRERAEGWSNREVVARWHRLYKGNSLSRRFEEGDPLLPTELAVLGELVDKWRDLLMDLSRFMGCLNEYIARKANREDECTGHFWEGRFKSKALLDEAALLTCMAYVDLNPVRARIADTLEGSEYTSVKQRIEWSRKSGRPGEPSQQPPALMPFVGKLREGMPAGLPFHLRDYLELVDWTGRAVRGDNAGAIAGGLPPMLTRLNMDPGQWLSSVQHFNSHFKGIIGSAHRVRRACAAFGKQWAHGIHNCRQLFP